MKRWFCVAMLIALRSLVAAESGGDPIMGDWSGKFLDGGERPIVAQVMALGQGTYRANLLAQFDTRSTPLAVLDGKSEDTAVVFSSKAESNTSGSGDIRDQVFRGSLGGAAFEMKKTVRLSPLLGATPPAGATVLLGPETTDLNAEWARSDGQPCGWKLLEGGVMQGVPKAKGVVSKRQFGSHKLHLEFRTPFEPDKRGQGRGNSGVYLHGRYEVQVLDSYGLEGLDNECGGIYKIAAPAVNMCAPPCQWQSYDITFHAPVLEGDKAIEPARVTVVHNGVKIIDHVAVPRPTAAAWAGNVAPEGPVYLQDHGHKVEYRNIWVEPIEQNRKEH